MNQQQAQSERPVKAYDPSEDALSPSSYLYHRRAGRSDMAESTTTEIGAYNNIQDAPLCSSPSSSRSGPISLQQAISLHPEEILSGITSTDMITPASVQLPQVPTLPTEPIPVDNLIDLYPSDDDDLPQACHFPPLSSFSTGEMVQEDLSAKPNILTAVVSVKESVHSIPDSRTPDYFGSGVLISNIWNSRPSTPSLISTTNNNDEPKSRQTQHPGKSTHTASFSGISSQCDSSSASSSQNASYASSMTFEKNVNFEEGEQPVHLPMSLNATGLLQASPASQESDHQSYSAGAAQPSTKNSWSPKLTSYPFTSSYPSASVSFGHRIPNSLNTGIDLGKLPRAVWCPDDDPRSELLHHPRDDSIQHLSTMMQELAIKECPWPSQYRRYIYRDAQGQQIPWLGARDEDGKLIFVKDDDEDFDYFLKTFPGGQRSTLKVPIDCINTGSRLVETLDRFGGHELVKRVEQQRQYCIPLPQAVHYRLKREQLNDDDLILLEPPSPPIVSGNIDNRSMPIESTSSWRTSGNGNCENGQRTQPLPLLSCNIV